MRYPCLSTFSNEIRTNCCSWYSKPLFLQFNNIIVFVSFSETFASPPPVSPFQTELIDEALEGILKPRVFINYLANAVNIPPRLENEVLACSSLSLITQMNLISMKQHGFDLDKFSVFKLMLPKIKTICDKVENEIGEYSVIVNQGPWNSKNALRFWKFIPSGIIFRMSRFLISSLQGSAPRHASLS